MVVKTQLKAKLQKKQVTKNYSMNHVLWRGIGWKMNGPLLLLSNKYERYSKSNRKWDIRGTCALPWLPRDTEWECVPSRSQHDTHGSHRLYQEQKLRTVVLYTQCMDRQDCKIGMKSKRQNRWFYLQCRYGMFQLCWAVVPLLMDLKIQIDHILVDFEESWSLTKVKFLYVTKFFIR